MIASDRDRAGIADPSDRDSVCIQYLQGGMGTEEPVTAGIVLGKAVMMMVNMQGRELASQLCRVHPSLASGWWDRQTDLQRLVAGSTRL